MQGWSYSLYDHVDKNTKCLQVIIQCSYQANPSSLRRVKWYHNGQVIDNDHYYWLCLSNGITTAVRYRCFMMLQKVAQMLRWWWFRTNLDISAVKKQIDRFWLQWDFATHLKQKTILLTTIYLIRNWTHWHWPREPFYLKRIYSKPWYILL